LKRLALAGLLALCGCGGVITPPKPPKPAPAPRDIPEIPRSFALEQTTRRKVDGLKIQVFDTGSAVVRGGAVSSMKSWRSKTKIEVPVFLIKHPREGYILFDTGLPPQIAEDAAGYMGRVNHMLIPFEQKKGQDAAAQLTAAGVPPDQVKYVVISHLHFDHAGMIDAFPNATVLVDKREWEAQKRKPGHGFIPVDTLEGKLKLRLVDLSGEPSYGPFDHGLDLFKDGTVYLLDLAGHTPGNMGLWASLDDGPVLLAGDASWVLDNHQDLALPIKGHIFDLDQYWRRLYQMKYAQEAVPQLVIFPGHDLQPLTLQPRKDVTLVPLSK
jgi:glyoxylase-like metal-dependent hydrolase (beta-lactamase superfamily II)